MEEKLIQIATNVLDIKQENISLNSSREDIDEWDSLAHLNLIAEIEEQFGVKIPFEEIHEIRKLSDFLKYINKNKPL
jgi:acyl carrier protein